MLTKDVYQVTLWQNIVIFLSQIVLLCNIFTKIRARHVYSRLYSWILFKYLSSHKLQLIINIEVLLPKSINIKDDQIESFAIPSKYSVTIVFIKKKYNS